MKVILSAKASAQLTALFDSLETHWSVASRQKFQKKLDRSMNAMKAFPKAFPASEMLPGCRKCVVTPQTSLIYRIRVDVIEIVALLDNRQE